MFLQKQSFLPYLWILLPTLLGVWGSPLIPPLQSFSLRAEDSPAAKPSVVDYELISHCYSECKLRGTEWDKGSFTVPSEANAPGDTMIETAPHLRDKPQLKAFQLFTDYLNPTVPAFREPFTGQFLSLVLEDCVSDGLRDLIRCEANIPPPKLIVVTEGIGKLNEHAPWKNKYGLTQRTRTEIYYAGGREAHDTFVKRQSVLPLFFSELEYSNLHSFPYAYGIFNNSLSGKGSEREIALVSIAVSRSEEILSAVGEGSDASREKAEDAARKNALSKLAEQVYVTVESEEKLRERLQKSVSLDGGKVQSDDLVVEYEKIVKVVSSAGLYGVTYTTLEVRVDRGIYTVRVKADVLRSKALQDFTARVVANIVQSLLDRKLLFTCRRFLENFDLKSFDSILPSVQQMFVRLGNFESMWRQFREISEKVISKRIETLEDAFEVGSLVSELEDVCIDYEDTLLSVKWLVEQWTARLKPEVIAQKHVWEGEKVKLKIKYPSVDVLNKVELKLNVVGKNCRPDRRLLTVKSGESTLWVLLESENAEVEFRFGGRTIATWHPERVFKTDSQVERDRISSVAVILGTLINDRQSELERRLSQIGLSLLVEVLRVELAQSSSIEITVLDPSSVETILGRRSFSNFDDLFRTLRGQRLGKYLILPSFSFTFERIGGLELILKVSFEFRIANLMTNENWTVNLSAEGLGCSAEEALRNIPATQEFKLEFSKRVVQLLKF